jgi:hypothetical protein
MSGGRTIVTIAAGGVVEVGVEEPFAEAAMLLILET